MKKLLLLFISVLSISNLKAQDITDAVRFSQDNIQGTARFRALSGAFGALGGDMSAVSINPAGSAIFNNSHASVSLSNLNIDNDVRYFNGNRNNSNSEFDFHQAGAVFVFNERSDSPWRKIVLSIAYDKTGNYDTDWIAQGTNSIRSIGNYFLENANGLRLGNISAFDGESFTDAYIEIGEAFGSQHQQAFLGFESFILEPDDINDDDNTIYTSNVGSGPYNQEYSYATTGYNGKTSFNIATQYQDNLYFGLNLNAHFINYERTSQLFESNNDTGAVINEILFNNALSTIGTGFSFQLGGIAKLNQNIRIGLTYNSPTWFNITDETTQSVEAFSADGISGANDQETFVVNPRVVNIFPEYKLQTPAKITGSVAIVFAKQGLISFDYSRKDYGKTKFKPTSDPDFSFQNNLISNNLKIANTYNIGGEYKYKNLSFRGGYRFEESPYENEDFYGDLTGYSLGLGYNFGNTKLDLTYDTSERGFNHQLYNIGLTDSASINRNNDNITLSLSFNL
jgi:long-subunit fatty acid transport protein